MRTCDIIIKKRDGLEHTYEEIDYLIQGYVNGSIPDYQLAAWTMAVYYRGLTVEETLNLTKAMVASGSSFDLTAVKGVYVDKHSTGGVADTTSLILVPLLAAADINVFKMSGRGLGYTGGTIDKLESIKGFRTEFNHEEIISLLKKSKAIITAQSDFLVPADKKLYALRDVTATIDIIPLIASSIMSKKIASGSGKILLDVKVGKGAFMKKAIDAEILAQLMVNIGTGMKKEVVAFITNMDEPLGNSVGNSLEVKEAIDILTCKQQGRLLDLSLEMAAEALVLTGNFKNTEQARNRAQTLLEDGSAAEKFREIIANQGGNHRVVDNTDLLPSATKKDTLKASREGFIEGIDAEKIGKVAMLLGAGRGVKEEKIFLEVGITFNKKTGSKVSLGDELAVIHSRDGYHADKAKKLIDEAITYCFDKPEEQPLIYKKITSKKLSINKE